jgi:hypothetical protein
MSFKNFYGKFILPFWFILRSLFTLKHLKHVFIASLAGAFSLLVFYLLRDIIFHNMIIEFLIFYSLLNFMIAIATFGLVYFVLRGKKFIDLQDTFTVFLFYFFFMNELLLTLILYDRLQFLGIYVPLGDCPWKWLRLTFTFVFLSTFLSLSVSFKSISAYINKRNK